jgi:hypothetical protein
MRQFLNKVMLVVALVMLMVGFLLLAYGYCAIWFTRHESDWPRAVMSFVYLIPGWALTTMGYVGCRIEVLEAARQGARSRDSA